MPGKYKQLLSETEGIEYHGLVSYDEVKRIIYDSNFLIHVEKNDAVLANELRYAFSTKIADSICSGRNFIVFAPETLACSQYILKTGAGWFAGDKAGLENVLRDALTDAASRKKKRDCSQTAARQNHTASKNQQRFLDALKSLLQ